MGNVALRSLGLWSGAQRVGWLLGHLRCSMFYELLPFLKIPTDGGTEAKSGSPLSLRLLISEMG